MKIQLSNNNNDNHNNSSINNNYIGGKLYDNDKAKVYSQNKTPLGEQQRYNIHTSYDNTIDNTCIQYTQIYNSGRD